MSEAQGPRKSTKDAHTTTTMDGNNNNNSTNDNTESAALVDQPPAYWQRALVCCDKYNCCLRALRQTVSNPAAFVSMTFGICLFLTIVPSVMLTLAPWAFCTLFVLLGPVFGAFAWLPLPRAIYEAPVMAAVREFVTQGRELDLKPLYKSRYDNADTLAIINGLYLHGIAVDVNQRGK